MNFLMAISRVICSRGKGDKETLDAIAQEIKGMMDEIVSPVLTVIGAAGVIYAIILGVNYIKAETPDKRKEAQSRLINAIIGVIILIAGIVLCRTIDWAGLVNMF